ncbi:MAG: hypothetical protein MK207_08735 [Saprospiraceae bacterium]|nr:hypothetical protein [Saprospiraceae bacterium]
MKIYYKIILYTLIFYTSLNYGFAQLSISNDKMNVLYVGVENPITIQNCSNFYKSLELSVSEGATLKKRFSDNSYSVLVKSSVKEVTITVKDSSNNYSMPFKYRVKPVPLPVVVLGDFLGGSISAKEFKYQLGLIPILRDFDFDARCIIRRYRLTHFSKSQKVNSITQESGGRFSTEVLNQIKLAQSGDYYIFDNIFVRCPGDIKDRKVESVTFEIE